MPLLLLESTPERDLRASTWHPPTLDMLDEFGLAAPLIARGLVTPAWQVRLHPSGERALFDLGVLAGETRHPYRLQCEQQVYCDLLEAGLSGPGGSCMLRRGVTVTGLRQSASAVAVAVEVRPPVPTRSGSVGWVQVPTG